MNKQTLTTSKQTNAFDLAFAKLKTKINGLDNDGLTDALALLTGSANELSREENLVRGLMLVEYGNRFGEDASDALMEQMGL